MKPKFSLCVDLATKLLANQSINSTKIDVANLNYDKNIIFDSIQNYCKLTGSDIADFINVKTQLLSEGCTLYYPKTDTYIVLHNDKDQSAEHLNWTRAHEIGHIYCGHKKDSNMEEIEAHFFAAQLLMPEYTIYEMAKYGPVDTYTLLSLFNVSITAARKRIATLNKKYSVNCSESDKKIWAMMKDSVENFYKNNYYSITICT